MTFDQAVEIILEREGGLVDHPQDPGGITNLGISLKAYPKLGREGIKNLTRESAKILYFRDYWLPMKCPDLPASLRLAVFDAAVNQGITAATKILQRAAKITADGKFGPVTLSAAQKLDLVSFLTERALSYVDTPNFSTFGRGWLSRLMHIATRS